MKLCRETRPLDHCSKTPLRLAAAPLARHFYCRDPGHINQPVVGPSTRLLRVPSSPTTTLSHNSAASPPSTSSASDGSETGSVCARSWAKARRCIRTCVRPRVQLQEFRQCTRTLLRNHIAPSSARFSACRSQRADRVALALKSLRSTRANSYNSSGHKTPSFKPLPAFLSKWKKTSAANTVKLPLGDK